MSLPIPFRAFRRVEAGDASIHGVSLEPKRPSIEVEEKPVRVRREKTVEVIHASLDMVRRTGY